MDQNKYKNKYRIKSTRLQGWDYGINAYYFVTICTKNREECFGKIINNKIILSQIGKITKQYWLKITNHFSFAILDEFIIMPNHIHGIIQINKTSISNATNCRDAIHRVSNNETNTNIHCNDQDAMNRVSTERRSKTGGITGEHNLMLGKTLGTIIRWFKGRISYECNKQNINFQWQHRFHDRIIRNELALNGIRYYIQINPQKWYHDRNHIENIWI